ncbi:hypothetical protein B0H10DRAFT_484287 [Mycena sp. CBHHK59/15]|nr:hypothetical protein B0H10DRAFT_484287 [Mycena sp. CBHHK59/15]
MRKKTSTTRLPQTLVEQIGDSSGNDQFEPRKKWSNKNKLSRKELRKQERTGCKQRKAEFFSSATPNAKRGAEEEHADSPKRKKIKLATVVSGEPKPLDAPPSRAPVQAKGPASSAPNPIKAVKPAKKTQTALQKLAGGSTSSSQLPRSQKDKEEEAYIAYLESKLGYTKGGKRKQKREDDGLDDLFDLASSLEASCPLHNEHDELNLESDDQGDTSMSEESADEEEGTGSRKSIQARRKTKTTYSTPSLLLLHPMSRLKLPTSHPIFEIGPKKAPTLKTL